VHVTLTDAELDALDELAAALTQGLGRPVHRGQMVGFLILRLRNRLRQRGKSWFPEEVNSLSALATYLDKIAH